MLSSKAEELFAKHWRLKTGKKLDEMTKAHMRYAIDAIEEGLNSKDKISIQELTQKIRFTDRSIESTSGFPKPIKNNSQQKEIFYSKEEICKYFKIDSLDEPFIDVDQAADLLKTTPNTIKKWVDNSDLPNYRLKNTKGSKILFRESDLLFFKKHYIDIGPNIDSRFINKFFLRKQLEEIFIMFLNTTESNILSYRQIEIIKCYLLNNDSMDKMVSRFELTENRIKEVIEKSINTLTKYIDRIKENKIASIYKENIELKAINQALLEKQKNYDAAIELTAGTKNSDSISLEISSDFINLMKTELIEYSSRYEMSVRMLGSLKFVKIYTMYDLLKYYYKSRFPEIEFTKIRNFGKKTFKETKQLVDHVSEKFPNIEMSVFFNHPDYISIRAKLQNDSNV